MKTILFSYIFCLLIHFFVSSTLIDDLEEINLLNRLKRILEKRNNEDCIQKGINLQGRVDEVKFDGVLTANECSSLCEDEDSCNFWVWHPKEAGYYAFKCALIHEYTNEAKDAVSWTGTKGCKIDGEECVLKDQNLQGREGNEKTENVETWGECATICKERSSCNAWVWHDESTGSYAKLCATVEGFGNVVDLPGVMVGSKTCQDEEAPVPPPTEGPPPPPSTSKETPPTSKPASSTETPPPPPTVSTTTVSTANTPFLDGCLKAHNKYRALHLSEDLQLDDELNRYAEEWAQHMVMTNSFEHRQNNAYGENLYMKYEMGEVKPDALGEDAVKAWYDEIKDYNANNPGFSMSTGHFTQVVWAGSKKLGCGYATGKKNGMNAIYIVSNYDPPGNMQGQFPENVMIL